MSYPLIFRIKAIEHYQDGTLSQAEVASNLGIHLSTFKRWLLRERLCEPLEAIKGENQGRPAKIDEKGLQTIERLVQEKPSITLDELSEAYERIHDVKTGRSILSRALKKLNLRRKKLSIQASEKNLPEVKKKKILLKIDKRQAR